MITPAQVAQRLEQAFQTVFFDPEERIYFEDGDVGYVTDTGNHDVRTEGMSYGMMIAVQMDRQDVFDRLWLWSLRHLWQSEGPYRGYLAWSAHLDGRRRAEGPAPDGEEYYALALFFASHRWGDREAPFDYGVRARSLLREVVHKGEQGPGHPMWDPETALIRFVPETPWTDPSYHLPHFYDLFSRWSDPGDAAFWHRAAQASRDHLLAACHPETGLAPEYAEYDGRPHKAPWDYGHHLFYSDSYRVGANIGVWSLWGDPDREIRAIAQNLVRFFHRQNPHDLRMYELDGTPLAEPALHPEGLIATNALAALAIQGPEADEAIRRFWNQPLRRGPRRYYDNCLSLFTWLALAGRYRVWEPAP